MKEGEQDERKNCGSTRYNLKTRGNYFNKRKNKSNELTMIGSFISLGTVAPLA
jgi:hypothetical protein